MLEHGGELPLQPLTDPRVGQRDGHALARSLFAPTTLGKAIARLGFVQADPIRAPARAQDLTLRHRVEGYRAGDLERRYPRLAIEEDFFVNYGFLPRATQALMHPRSARTAWPSARRKSRTTGCASHAPIASVPLTLRRRKDVKTQDVAKQVAARREDNVRLVQMPAESRKPSAAAQEPDKT